MLFIGDKPTLVGMRGLAGVPGVDYNCSSSICYGIGTLAHQQLMSVQTALNRFARSAGFSPLVVDGKIGDKTVSAVRATFAWVKSKGVEIDAAQAALTPEALTAASIGPSGSGFAMMINALADKYKPATGSSGGGGGGGGTTTVPDVTVPGTTTSSSGKVPTWLYYAAAGVGGLGLLVAAYKLSARTVPTGRAPIRGPSERAAVKLLAEQVSMWPEDIDYGDLLPGATDLRKVVDKDGGDYTVRIVGADGETGSQTTVASYRTATRDKGLASRRATMLLKIAKIMQKER